MFRNRLRLSGSGCRASGIGKSDWPNADAESPITAELFLLLALLRRLVLALILNG
jgi:hypothetical protein